MPGLAPEGGVSGNSMRGKGIEFCFDCYRVFRDVRSAMSRYAGSGPGEVHRATGGRFPLYTAVPGVEIKRDEILVNFVSSGTPRTNFELHGSFAVRQQCQPFQAIRFFVHRLRRRSSAPIRD